MMAEPIIEVKNLSKRYVLGMDMTYKRLTESITNSITHPIRTIRNATAKREEFWALKDVSFTVEKGDVVGIIGRNGAGKSTLLKILSQITWPTEGEVVLHGRVGSLLEVGTGFHPELSGRENIYLNGAILGMKKKEIDAKFEEIVKFAEIDKFLDTPVKRYSSGMYVRLAFAVAAHMDPEILIVDEVLAVGDAQFQKKCLGKMKDVSEGGRTVLFVSHNMGAISNLCSKAILLESGKVQCIGQTPDVIQNYVSTQKDSSADISWDNLETAPGNENVRLKSVKLISKGEATTNVLINEEMRIEITYCVLKENAILDLNIHLMDYMGQYVFATGNRGSTNLIVDEWFGKMRPKGHYKSVCVIPANFLNDKHYSISVGITNERDVWQVDAKSVIFFNVVETGEMRKEYMGDWVGVVRPKLAWTTERIGD